MAQPSELPSTIDTAVIGGGIAGCATAWELARRGVAVAVLEAGDFNALASGANAGSLHAQLPMDPFVEGGEAWAARFASTLRLLQAAVACWRGLAVELGAELEVAITGGLLVAESDAQLAVMARKVAVEQRIGLRSALLDRNALRALAPYVGEQMVGAAFCADEGKASPLAAGPAFAAAASRAGARLLPFTAVGAAEPDGAGYRLATARGTLLARRVVVATGAEAGRTARLFGVELPIWGLPIQASVTEPVAAAVPHLVYFAGAKLTLKQTAAGALLIGGGWPAGRDALGRPCVDGDNLRRNLAVATRVVPAVGRVRLLRSWPGVVNANADWRPVLGAVPGRPGLFLNCFPWMGFTAAPLCARLTAQLLTGEAPQLDIAEFAIGRHAA